MKEAGSIRRTLRIVVIGLVSVLCVIWMNEVEGNGEEWNQRYEIKVEKPRGNEYWCRSLAVPTNASSLIGFAAIGPPYPAHHIILRGCLDSTNSNPTKCGAMSSCQGGQYLYAWAHGATELSLPEKVGYFIKEFKYLQIEAHFGKDIDQKLNVSTTVGLNLLFSTATPERYATLIVLATGGVIPARSPAFELGVHCTYGRVNQQKFTAFAYRTHCHDKGSRIWGKKTDPYGNISVLGDRDPQLPQIFVPMDKEVVVNGGDRLDAFCIYNTTSVNTKTYIGSSSDDEMCNLYVLGWTETFQQSKICVGGTIRY